MNKLRSFKQWLLQPKSASRRDQIRERTIRLMLTFGFVLTLVSFMFNLTIYLDSPTVKEYAAFHVIFLTLLGSGLFFVNREGNVNLLAWMSIFFFSIAAIGVHGIEGGSTWGSVLIYTTLLAFVRQLLNRRWIPVFVVLIIISFVAISAIRGDSVITNLPYMVTFFPILGGIFWREARAFDETLEMLSEREQDLRQFFGGFAHDLRLPIRNILQAISSIVPTLKGTMKDILVAAETQSKDMLNIVNSMMELAAAREGKLELESIEINPAIVINSVIDAFKPEAEKKNVKISLVEFGKSFHGFTFQFDEVRLRQMLTNLIGNALKFTEKGEIKVSAVVEAGKVHISVTDSGPGIKPENLPSIGSAFFRTPEGKKAGGTGLGLAMTKAILAQAGGELQVQSTYGEGSSFTLVIPKQ